VIPMGRQVGGDQRDRHTREQRNGKLQEKIDDAPLAVFAQEIVPLPEVAILNLPTQ